MCDPLNCLGSIWLENIHEIKICGGGDFFCGGWNFSKSVSVDSMFIREMRVNSNFKAHFNQLTKA